MSGEERVCRYPCDCGQFPEEHCACMDGHASPPAATASTGVDAEALAEDIYYWLIAEGYYGHYPSAEEPARRLAEQTLASDWLAAHDAATAERVRRETLDGLRLVIGMSGHRFFERSDHAEALRMIDEAREQAR